MKDLVRVLTENLSITTLVKLERRAALEGKTLHDYVVSFLADRVEPNR